MKVAILAGGLGTRLSEETEIRPKPMVEIGERPILWHIMRHFSHFGHSEFVVALGYKSEYVKRFFADYYSSTHSIRVDLGSGDVESHRDGDTEKWLVDLIETGRWTNTGGRIKRLRPHLGNETFFLTWGDGVADLNINDLLAFHQSHGKLLTVTAVHPPPRFGQLILDGTRVVDFTEKPIEKGWINGAFFVCEPEVHDYIAGDETLFEKEPMEQLANEGQLMAYRHDGYWQCMDTMRDKVLLNRLWESGNAPWKIWD